MLVKSCNSVQIASKDRLNPIQHQSKSCNR
jgi:hypothetical protein